MPGDAGANSWPKFGVTALSARFAPGSGWPKLNMVRLTTRPFSTPIISRVLMLCSTPMSLLRIVTGPRLTTWAQGMNRHSSWSIR